MLALVKRQGSQQKRRCKFCKSTTTYKTGSILNDIYLIGLVVGRICVVDAGPPIISPNSRRSIKQKTVIDMPKYEEEEVDDRRYNPLYDWIRGNLPKPNQCECGYDELYDVSCIGECNRDVKNWKWVCKGCRIKYNSNIGVKRYVVSGENPGPSGSYDKYTSHHEV
jgi:hypothetical protein